METKVQIRKRIRQQRTGITEQEVKQKSHLICDKLCQLPIIEKSDTILVYASTQNEVDLTLFIQRMKENGKTLYFPRVEGENLIFCLVEKEADLQEGYFGIWEPISSCKVFEEEDGAVIVPGVAFSKSGQRIGYGKGFYDRFLERFPKLRTIGVAYDFQIVDSIEAMEHDISMEMVITEKSEVV